MSQNHRLDNAQIILRATKLIADADFAQLQLLATEHTQVLPPALLFRQLLNYLPPDAERIPGLVQFLTHVEHGFKDVSSLDEGLEQPPSEATQVQEPEHLLHELRLGRNTELLDDVYDDNLAAFIVQWLRKVEMLGGVPISAIELVYPFTKSRPRLSLWQDAYLVPVIKLQNNFYPGRAENVDVEMLEQSYGLPGVRVLLQYAEQDGEKAQIRRDLEEVVSPWVRGSSRSKRRKLTSSEPSGTQTSWHDVNEWIYETSRKDFSLAARSFLEWDGPTVDSQQEVLEQEHSGFNPIMSYAQTGMALVLMSKVSDVASPELLKSLLRRAASLAAIPSISKSNASELQLSSASRADLLENAMLDTKNPITSPRDETYVFFDHCLTTQRILEDFKVSMSVVAIAEIALFGSEVRQNQQFLSILQQIPRLTRAEIDWPSIRRQLYVLQSESDIPSSKANDTTKIPYFLGHVKSNFLESELLDVILANGRFTVVSELYLDTSDSPLDRDIVQDHIVSAIYLAYDNATNGNRTRGGMKRAYELLKAFQPRFPPSNEFSQIDHLIKATNSLSFYQLTLQQGIPFQPASIRIHHDPLSLIEKVLAQNHKAYTKLDDLIEIGRNLVLAGVPRMLENSLPSKSTDHCLFDAQHRVTYLAVNAALTDHDFDTAYSYITTRLSTSPSQMSKSTFTDDTSWRAAYAAGKYRPSTSPKSLHDRITSLSKRMDLLSLALTLTPTPYPLSEILATWRRCEEELDSLKSQAVEEERAADTQFRANSSLPGGFTEDRDVDAAETRRMMERRALGGSGPSYEEDAPMGLFDVARGAASAFRKTAFPLGGASGQLKISSRAGPDSSNERESLDEMRTSGELQRVRKRDMVSNMVTGGFVSGMSWVLGAPATNSTNEK